MFKAFTLCFIFFLVGASAASALPFVQQQIPDAQKVGQGILSFAFWDVYQATLYAPKGQWDPQKPFALSLEYYREIAGKDIAERSLDEIKKQGFDEPALLTQWQQDMQAIFPDVQKGSVLSAVYNPQKGTTFYNGETPIGTIAGDAFAERFFGIWLAETTSEPALRQALLGL